MKFKILKDNYEINNIDDYRELCGPVEKYQWKDKRSAKEFAKYLLTNYDNLPKEIEQSLPIKNEGEMILYPEYLTGFGKYGMDHRGPRHHDGLLIGDDIVVGIEAKADEPLDGKYLSEYDSNKKRYKNISFYLFGDEPSNHSKARYQLCSSTMATLIEAKERSKKVALMLVISFISKEGTKPEKVQRNIDDINSFKESLTHIEGDQYQTPFSKEHNIKLFIKTIEIDLDK